MWFVSTVCGCNKLLSKDFNGVSNCKGFIQAYPNWQEKYYKKLKEMKK